MGRTHNFFSHMASKTRFFSSDSASIFFISLLSRYTSLSRRASLISMCPNCFFHRWKLPPRDLHPGRCPECFFHHDPPPVICESCLPSCIVCLSFVWSFLASQTNTSTGPKK